MRKIQCIVIIASLLFGSQLKAQCPYDNTFYADLTPTVAGNVQTESCAWAGEYFTVDVLAGETYIFSTCGSIGAGVDSELTLYYSAGTTILGNDDDGCGLFSTITWVATYTGTAHLLLDEWLGSSACSHGTNCYELSVTWVSLLPIEIINFDVKVFDHKVLLTWETASEIDNDFFTIERSVEGINWEEVNEVDGAGNSSSLLSYRSYDEKPYHGISYYRLKQTDLDGNFSYSEIRNVNIPILEDQNALEIYPNPTEYQITITGNETELKQIKIYDVLGEDITNLTKFIISSDSKLVIDLSNLNTGIYYIKTKTTASRVYKQ